MMKVLPKRWRPSFFFGEAVEIWAGRFGRIEILPDPLALAHHVAEWMTRAALAAHGPFRVSLSGGSTPKTLYGLLASDEFRNQLPVATAFLGIGAMSASSRTIIPTAIIG